MAGRERLRACFLQMLVHCAAVKAVTVFVLAAALAAGIPVLLNALKHFDPAVYQAALSLHEANAAWNRRDYQAAEEMYLALDGKLPSDAAQAALCQRLAMLYEETGRTEKAHTELERAAALYGNDQAYAAERALTYGQHNLILIREAGDAAAFSRLTDLIPLALDSAHPAAASDACILLARGFLAAGQCEQAAIWYEKRMKLCSAADSAFAAEDCLQQARLQLMLHHDAAAAETCSAALRQCTDAQTRAELELALAAALARSGEPDAARAALAQGDLPGNSTAHCAYLRTAGEISLCLQDSETAAKYAAELLEYAAEQPEYALSAGVILERAERPESAQDAYAQGAAFAAEQDHPAAEADCLHGLCRVRMTLADYAGADAAGESALELLAALPRTDRQIPVLADLALLAAYSGDMDAAQGYLRRAREIADRQEILRPESAAAPLASGRIALFCRRTQEAVSELQNAAEIYMSLSGPRTPEYAKARLWLGDALMQAGAAEEAAAAYQDAAKVFQSCGYLRAAKQASAGYADASALSARRQ